MDWARNPRNRRLLLWIYGPAGAGKSTIMQTIAEQLKKLGILGGSFFFSGTIKKQNEKTHFVTTLAYQLASIVPNFEDYLAQTIDRDPSILSRPLAVQIKALIIDPIFAAARNNTGSRQWNYVILIDGLDECTPPGSQREIITLLSSFNSPPFRFIVASRPENAIRSSFRNVMDRIEPLPLDIIHLPDDDVKIRSFLGDKLRGIASHPAHHSIPKSWPRKSTIDTLV